MLRYFYLALLVATSAASVLKVEDHGDYPEVAKDTAHESSYGQPVKRFNLYNKGREGLHHDYKFGLNSKFGSIHCPLKPGNVLDCSRLNIADISELNIPFNIIGLDLSFNYLETIPAYSLVNFTQLEWLNISYNKLQNFSDYSFYNLSALKILRINSNYLTMHAQTFPVNVFKPLVNLRQLWMQNNTHVKIHQDLNYPDDALAFLHNVTDLYIDGLPNKTFGQGFGNMISLVNLTLNGRDEGYCHLASLASNMFTHLGGLTNLSLINCNISGKLLDADVFKPLTELVYLDLSGNDDLKLEPLGEALNNIKNQSKIKVLNISNIINPYSAGVFVSTNFSMSLPTELDELDVASNALQVLDEGVLDSLPKSLRVLHAGSNKFAFLDYLKYLGALTNLKYLTLSREDAYILPYYYPPNPNKQVQPSNGYGKFRYIDQPLPPNLHALEIMNAGWSNYLTKFNFNATNTLKILRLDFNNFPLLQGPITGLHHLKKLSLYSCRIREIQPLFFQNFTSLEILNLSTNYFGRVSFRANESIFSNLVNLTILDLSFTDIWYISYYTFTGLDKLEKLYLQLNPITIFYVDISRMFHLRYINLTMTSLVTIQPDMTQMLDGKHNESFSVDFSKNTFDCFCSHLEFLKWTSTTKVISKGVEVTCSFVDGTKRDLELSELMTIYGRLMKECASNVGLFSVVISVTLVLFFAIIGAILFNFRWKLRYLYYSAVLHYKTSKRETIEESFQYDVFVSYAHEDNDFVVDTLYPQLQLSGLKIHIHGLHFTAGDFISSNIVNAIQSSRHTLVVLTQHHVSSKWSQYEVEMANMEQVHTGRSVLIFLVKENIPKLTTQLFYHMKRNTYIKYPETESSPIETSAFWTKLVYDLKS